MMSPLIIQGSDKTFSFHFAPGLLKIIGCSYPSDTVAQFREPLHWVEKYAKNPEEVTLVDCNFECCDSASSKQVMKLLYILKNGIVSAGKVLRVRWKTDDDDDDDELIFLAQTIAERLHIAFEYYN